MLNVIRNSAGATLALAVVLALSFASQAPAAEGKGKVTGKVLGKDGAGVAGARVQLVKPPEKKDKKGEKAAAAADEKPGKGEGKNRQEPVAKTMSEADGSYTLADVPAGDYMLTARTKDKLQAREKVTVKANEETKVDLKLAEPGQGKKKKKNE